MEIEIDFIYQNKSRRTTDPPLSFQDGRRGGGVMHQLISGGWRSPPPPPRGPHDHFRFPPRGEGLAPSPRGPEPWLSCRRCRGPRDGRAPPPSRDGHRPERK
jgi:hypothetical protein